MMNNWVDTLTNMRKAGSAFAESNPAVVTAYRGLNEALGQGKALDAKTRELIALAVAVTTRCDGCISSHAAAAQKAGATIEEVSEALGTAVALNAGAAYVYSVRAIEAFGQFDK
ncbi:carboxymuconolactone decarboxylase family protein [Paralcaligenes sp. KSB-10]|jgi:AhpD family alkylhydroperoxidase|uniref:carboxymuconolactone decarboxylase family protein n=1 Tax=Paralcaligenes sp. KSB-10 TaxID=2901142 RepID=UPI001E2C282B|nr:carboxymuconolactone decarboxylase family protein [Paralcaligenes sp. KSB-10]UHL63543.1 carboxymuconolactone decarboxylase family protein [Paralcaligenes sp. KSB-10]